MRDESTFLPMSKIILGLCTSRRLYPIGRDDAVRAKSNRDFGKFLSLVFEQQLNRSR